MGKYLFFVLILFGNCLFGYTQPLFQNKPSTILNARNPDVPIVLRGTIITPGGPIKHGYLAILNGRILSVSDKPPNIPGADTLNTQGIILPGFVDLHNHIVYNVLPRWKPGRLYTDRDQWRNDPDQIRLVAGPISRLRISNFCDMNTWGELRALVGGTTSILATEPKPCIHGLVRNLDYNSGFYGTVQLNREHIINRLGLPSDPVARLQFADSARVLFKIPFFEAFFIHLAEGTDSLAEDEMTFVASASLLDQKAAIIHGISLTYSDFQAMAQHGTALVWSPRSNIELYGQTTHLDSALIAGVEIALAPDWAVTGSSNILDELKVAAKWNHEHPGSHLSGQQLVDMVTTTPARIAGIDDEVGTIKPGLRADILVIDGDHNDPYQAVLDATASDVGLVLIDGVPLYGDRQFMKRFWLDSELEEVGIGSTTKVLSTPATSIRVADVTSRLQPAMISEGVSLAPLVEIGDAPPSRIQGFQIQNSHDAISGKFSVRVLPNPSSKYFALTVQSNSIEPIYIRIMDISGRTSETRNGIHPNSTIQIGNSMKQGVYFVEVIQGANRKILKLIRSTNF